jgi:hypothetical protein
MTLRFSIIGHSLNPQKKIIKQKYQGWSGKNQSGKSIRENVKI